MADAAISATVKVVLETVISIAADRVGMVLGVKAELERLSNTAATIRGFLADADGKMHSPGVRDWLKKLEDEVFKADTVLDELNYDNLRREVKYRNQLTKKKVCFFFSFFNAIGFSSSLASRIRDINTNFKRINQQANDLGLVTKYQIEAALPADAAGATTSRQTDSIILPNVVGRSGDESKIVGMLLTPSERVVSVIPITGMGGLGKTTLAKSVYNNTKIDENFGIKSWVCVARKIDIVELFKLILKSLTRTKVEVDDREAIVQEIRGKLGEKRFLLVLDDVWNCEPGLWSDFFATLLGLSTTKGSWCILTTRLQPVANAVLRHLQMNGGPYFLGKLSGDECWSIIKRKVLAREEVTKELEAIQEQILRRCDGLPLAASLIGGLLLNNRREKWHSIVQESLLNEDQSEIDQILKVSFDHLSPPSVKKCFAYCSIFRQDTELGEDELIQHWVAEGFVQPDRQNQRLMEEIAGDYLRILLQNSLLEEVEESWRTYYKMHDLVHDFAKSVLNPKSSSQDRYLALHSYEEMAENVRWNKAASIRSLFLHLGGGISADTNMLSRFKHLHVLKLSGYDVMFLPSSIGKLLHLRLLDISSSRIKSLPESLCKLYNLHTLTIRNNALGGGFPKRMNDLISLRHLNYHHHRAKFKMPMQMGQLTCLQTLKFFNVSQEKGCGIEELGTLKYLRGPLEIRNLELVEGKDAAKQAKLFEKPNLSRLRLDFRRKRGHQKSDNSDEDVLEGLQPHPNLQKLEIRYFMGDKFSQWLINLPKLVELWIEDCKRCSELPSLGQLPSLKRLFLNRLENIRSVGDEFYGITTNEEGEDEGRSRASGSSTRRRKFFPALEELRVAYMKNLVEWKDADQVRSTIAEEAADVFPMLRDLSIQHCPQLTTLPCSCKILDVQYCRNLTSIKTGYGTASVEKLKIGCCNNLRELPEDVFGSSLQRLSIESCPRLISLGVNGLKCPLPCLERLSIQYCVGLTTISDKMFESCQSLRSLSVECCPNLVSFSLNLQEMPSLEDFALLNCPKLIPHRFNGFAFATNLRKLWIGPFSSGDSSIDGFDWSGLRSASTLRKVHLEGLRHSDFLPHQLQYLTTLTSLNLKNFGGIEVLPDWIGNLVSLETLQLSNCEKLRCLLSEAAMRRLTKLTSVEVRRCPLLRQRYAPQRGIYLEE
ncbi:putative disease resistance protein RGA4 [Coffea arabica]|uniref:Disease resistance protein RGA4 n=1 Tax=Coffea arabica TaxID=13443 RepID=A0A6P6TAD8_COFAR